MDRPDMVQSRMKEDELVSRIRYHEDRLRAIEREATFHRATLAQAFADLEALRQPSQPQTHLVAV